MAPHSSTLAWKIPWTEEPGRLQSMGSLRVRHDWASSLSLFTFMHWRRKWQPTPVFLPGESQGPGSLMGCRLWVAQSRTRLKRLSSSSSSSAWVNTQGLVSQDSFPVRLHPSPRASGLPEAPLPAEVPRSLHSQEGVLNWGPQHHGAGVWVIFCVPPSQRVRPLGFGFTRILAPARANQTVQV